jgi:thioredoxin-related protein
MALSPLRRRAAVVLTAAMALATSTTALAQSDDWKEGWILDDLAKAKEVAKEQGKDLLIDFTGSDWCIWCKRLDQEVFSQSQFKAEAPKDFVLVALDFPSDNGREQTDAVKAANQEAAREYAIQGYPTIILAEPSGEPYARTGYRPNGAGPYLEHLDQLQTGKDRRDELMSQAKDAEGVAKARLLDQALSIANVMVPDREKVMEQIVALDAENEAGLKAKYESQLADARVRATLAEAGAAVEAEDYARAAEILDGIQHLDKVSDEVRAEVAMTSVSVLYFQRKYDEMAAKVAELMKNDDLPVDMRQQLSMARLEAAIAKSDVEMAERIMDETIALDPTGQMGIMLAQQREQIMATVKARMEQAQPGG